MIPELILKRVTTNQTETSGVLIYKCHAFAVTYELPWRDNKKSVSCIPAGVYFAKKRVSTNKNYIVFELEKVPGRTYIQMHMGKVSKHTKGCILVGEEFGFLESKPVLLRSKHGFKEMMALFKGIKRIKLVILDCTKNTIY